jgi:hypothetical protein
MRLVGKRVLDSAAMMLMVQFFASADTELKAEPMGAVAHQGVFITFWRCLRNVTRSLFRCEG